MNFKMVRFKMMKLTGREKSHVVDADATISWMLLSSADSYVREKERD
jgi:hypothetical protein